VRGPGLLLPPLWGSPSFSIDAYWKAIEKAGLIRWEEKDGDMIKVLFRFHDLRHSVGSRLGMNGTDLKSIMEIMGHKTAKVAMRYQHPSPDHKLKAVRSLDIMHRTKKFTLSIDKAMVKNH